MQWVVVVVSAVVVIAGPPAYPVLPIHVGSAWPKPNQHVYMGDVRAIVQVPSAPQGVVASHTAQIYWRRRDPVPHNKSVIVVDEAGHTLPHTDVHAVVTQECGLVTFSAAQGTQFHVYYLPHITSGGGAHVHFSWYNGSGVPLPGDASTCRTADPAKTTRVTALEVRDAFHGITSMELIATREEVDYLSKSNQHTLLVWMEPNTQAVRMWDHIPASWYQRATLGVLPRPNTLQVSAAPGQFLVFQAGVYAPHVYLPHIGVTFSGLTGASSVPATAFRCFNLEGVDQYGVPFVKTYNLHPREVGSLWMGIDLPEKLPTGTYEGSVTISGGSVPVVCNLTVIVKGPALPRHGDDNVYRFTRLRWLDSTVGIDDHPTAPYTPVSVGANRTVTLLNKRVRIGGNGFPESILVTADKHRRTGIVQTHYEVLSSPMVFTAYDDTMHPIPTHLATPATVVARSPDIAAWTSTQRSTSGLELFTSGTVESDSYMEMVVAVVNTGTTPMKLGDVRLSVSMPSTTAHYMLGMASEGSDIHDIEWKWSAKRGDCMLWRGRAEAGLLVKLKGAGNNWNSPMYNKDYSTIPYIPTSWGGVHADGSTGANVTGETLITYSGPRTLAPGKNVTFHFNLIATPARPVDMKSHWAQRYFQVGYGTPYESPQKMHSLNVTVVTLHQGTPGIINGSLVNPYINYPFVPDTIPLLQNYSTQANALGMAVKFYYTIRELSNHAIELYALWALRGEIITNGDGYTIPQPGYCHDWDCHGGAPYLHEHMIQNYTSCWQQALSNGEWDAAVCDIGVSRWFNYYLEGLQWSMQQPPHINGIYYDGINFDRLSVQRIRKTVDKASQGRPFPALLDLHSGHNNVCPPAVCYLSHYAYVNSLWNGEGFDFNKGPIYWLVEVSGQPMGLSGDRLGGGSTSDDFKGMLYGMARRNSGTSHALWALWDIASLKDSVMIGWWEVDVPVQLNYTCAHPQPPYSTRVLATVYAHFGSRVLVAIASHCPSTTEVTIHIDWDALGIDSKNVTGVLPNVPGLQHANVVPHPATPVITLPGQEGAFLWFQAK